MDKTPSHVLNASDLHTLAPGIIKVIHGPDGDFEGAPPWTGPVWWNFCGGRWAQIDSFDAADETFHLLDDPREWSSQPCCELGDLRYDLRVPSVQNRFKRLCELALGGPNVTLFEMDEWGGACLRCGDEVIARWTQEGQPAEAHPFGPVRFPSIGRDWLKPLVMALAGEIATLGVSR